LLLLLLVVVLLLLLLLFIFAESHGFPSVFFGGSLKSETGG